MRRGIAVLAAILGLAGCGSSAGGATKPTLTISAAASLKSALTHYDASFTPAQARAQFAGSDILAAQIEQGARPDLFAAANASLPQLLFAKHLVERPVAIAANRLVIAVPATDTRIRSLADLERPGTAIAVGSPTVPIGVYTRKVLARLGSRASRILGNVRTQEPDVSGIVGKLTQGAAAAGFTYASDVRATHGQLRAIALPASLQPVVTYAAAVVRGTTHDRQAAAYLAGLRSGAGQRDLIAAGFLPPP
ncbi:MAG TPA: molybdate ABC transporter substrate-binding protein [Solirubrobacteraceae bacterium]|nr:molybdate ABC transporter substrate-binding protein [Solirubrobacteraceae bacterium]